MKAKVWLVGLGAVLAIGVAGSVSEAGMPPDPGARRDSSTVRSFDCPAGGSLAEDMMDLGGVRGAGDCQSFGPC